MVNIVFNITWINKYKIKFRKMLDRMKEFANDEKMMSRIYELTDYPKIFSKTYWG